MISAVIVARLALLTTALALCAWYALGVRSVHDQNRVNSVLAQPGSLTASQARAARALLSDARMLNPDPALDVLGAELEQHAGNLPLAVRLAKDVVRRQPRDADAWLALELISRGFDPAASRLAQAQLRALVPPR